ncbi:hypothetical protein C8R44DRAFT_581590, partial [Mycena epipterygia]
ADSAGGAFQFAPNAITATNGTVVTFIFSGSPGNHSITQLSFTQPCVALPGGKDSGFLPGTTNNIHGFPLWSFTVNDDQTPLWFFCRQRVPTSHCRAGMVFALNAPRSG